MSQFLSEISHHVETRIGKIKTVFHEKVSDDLHIDVLHIPSTFFRRYETLVTCGASDYEMDLPEDSTLPSRAEYLILLPKGWPLEASAFNDERNYWPIRLLKDLARFPKAANTYFCFGHTMATPPDETGKIPSYADNTELCATMLLTSPTFDEKSWELNISKQTSIIFYCAIPLYASELSYKLEHGSDALFNIIEQKKLSDVINVTRKAII